MVTKMPRESLNKKEYLRRDLRVWMEGQMRVLGKTQAYMGERLKITGQAFGSRLRSGKFDNTQLYVIFKELEATDEKILQLMRM